MPGQYNLADAEATQRDPLDYSDKYNTPIPANRQADFDKFVQRKIQTTGKDPRSDRYDYDVNGYFLSGGANDPRGHGPDTFKKPNHPTFSDESKYNGVDGFQGGHWSTENGKDSYTASPTNIKFRDPQTLSKYFQDTEPGTTLKLPAGSQSGKYSLAEAQPIESPQSTAPSAAAQIGTSLKNQGKGLFEILHAVVDPHVRAKMAQGMADAQVEQWDKAKEEYAQGNYANAARRGLAAAVPILGPLIEKTAEKATTGGRPYEAATDILAAPVIGKGLGATAEAIPAGTATAVGRGIGAAAPDIAMGAAKTAGGVALGKGAEMLGMGPVGEYLAAKDLIRNGVRQIGGGVKTGYAATKASLAERIQAAAKAAEAPAAETTAEPPLAGPVTTPQPQPQPLPASSRVLQMPQASHPPFAANAPFSPSAAARQQAPATSIAAAHEQAMGMAKMFQTAGISAEDLAKAPAEQWEGAARLGGFTAPSKEVISRTLFRLRQLEKAAPSAGKLAESLAQ